MLNEICQLPIAPNRLLIPSWLTTWISKNFTLLLLRLGCHSLIWDTSFDQEALLTMDDQNFIGDGSPHDTICRFSNIKISDGHNMPFTMISSWIFSILKRFPRLNWGKIFSSCSGELTDDYSSEKIYHHLSALSNRFGDVIEKRHCYTTSS